MSDHRRGAYRQRGAMSPIAEPLGNVLLKAAMGQIAQLLNMRMNDRTIRFLFEVYDRVIQDPRERRYLPAYDSFRIPKRNQPGAYRTITAPNKGLKFVQERILHEILEKHYTPTIICHSVPRQHHLFGAGIMPRSIVSNAFAHLGVPPGVDPHDEGKWDEIKCRRPQALFGVDVKDAFPSITDEHVFAIFERIIGDPMLALTLTRLCTWNGCLPQGAPTSSLLLNMVFEPIDVVLQKEFGSFPFRVTRYVDDITVTSTRPAIKKRDREKLVMLLADYGFQVNEAKTCYWLRRRHVLLITGLNIFSRLSRPPERAEEYEAPFPIGLAYTPGCVVLPPRTVDQFRTLLHGLTLELRSFDIGIRGCLEEAREGMYEECASEMQSLRKQRKKPFYRILGILAFCVMVYGDQIPGRIYGGCRELKESNGFFAELIEFIKERSFSETYDAMEIASGY